MKKSDLPLTITGLLIIALALGIWAISDAAHAEGNWCAEWEDGYTQSYYLMCGSCQSIPPQVCPYPVETEDRDGYMRGVVEGAEAGTKAQEYYL